MFVWVLTTRVARRSRKIASSGEFQEIK